MMIKRFTDKEALLQDSVFLQEVVGALKNGAVIVTPTDTIYGLSCLASQNQAIARIANMKGRENNKPFLLLVADWDMIDNWAELGALRKKWLEDKWPGPTTVILPAKHQIACLTSDSGGVAIRWPQDDFLLKLIKLVGEPLVSTSLNKAGEPALVEPINLDKYFFEAPDIVIDIGVVSDHASAIIDLQDMKNPVKIR